VTPFLNSTRLGACTPSHPPPLSPQLTSSKCELSWFISYLAISHLFLSRSSLVSVLIILVLVILRSLRLLYLIPLSIFYTLAWSWRECTHETGEATRNYTGFTVSVWPSSCFDSMDLSSHCVFAFCKRAWPCCGVNRCTDRCLRAIATSLPDHDILQMMLLSIPITNFMSPEQYLLPPASTQHGKGIRRKCQECPEW
jgi:hypothetical protein